eukprot:Colp12_sorted_trinity150504_noHs@30693
MVTASASQMEPLDARQVRNQAGGFVYKTSQLQRLRRFFCLGVEGGTYYATEKELSIENTTSIIQLIRSNGEAVVAEAKKFSVEGRVAKEKAIIFTLALCARLGDEKTKKAAYSALNDICRIPTSLFMFVGFCEAVSTAGTGWGRAHRRAVANWYNSKTPMDLAMHITKYQNREGWTHLDLLRLSHTAPTSPAHALIFHYIVKGQLDASSDSQPTTGDLDTATVDSVRGFLHAVLQAKHATTPEELIPLITQHALVREHVPTTLLGARAVWEHLLIKMPLMAMIRNLGKMSALGLFEDAGNTQRVTSRLQNEDALKRARIHPFNVLVALKTYAAGRGDKGKLTWPVEESIVDALDKAFYLAFRNVEPTNKRFCLALDVSGSMSCGKVCGSTSLTPRDACAAMALVTAATEPNHKFVGFSHRLVPVRITPDMRLDAVVQTMQMIPMGGTDCSLPILEALKRKKEFDTFIIYTDNETYYGSVHPSEALRQYRAAVNPHAQLIVVAFAVTGFTIADPADKGMMDMAGFDAAAPEVMRQFVLGEI